MFNLFKSDSQDKEVALVALINGSQVNIKSTKNVFISSIGYGNFGKPTNCQVSPDFKLVIATTDKGIICLSETNVGGIRRTFGTTTMFGSGAKAISASWINNEKVLVNTNKGTNYELNVRTGGTKKIS
ncbi:MAG: hypothetical protein HDS18_00080 [Bacteroides sp.]|nr:hypothetical protein [Bacteroides sp.]